MSDDSDVVDSATSVTDLPGRRPSLAQRVAAQRALEQEGLPAGGSGSLFARGDVPPPPSEPTVLFDQDISDEVPNGEPVVDDVSSSVDVEAPSAETADAEPENEPASSDIPSSTDEVAEPSSEMSPAEEIFSALSLIAKDPNISKDDVRTHLGDVTVASRKLSIDECKSISEVLIANKGKFEQRSLHFTIKQLLQSHPAVTRYRDEHGADVDPKVRGGIAGSLIDGRVTWDTVSIHPPRPKVEPADVDASVSTTSSDDISTPTDPVDSSPEPADDGQDTPVVVLLDPSNNNVTDDPILIRLDEQVAALEAMGF